MGLLPEWNQRIENAVIGAVKTGNVPRDLGGNLGTKAMGDWIVTFLKTYK